MKTKLLIIILLLLTCSLGWGEEKSSLWETQKLNQFLSDNLSSIPDYGEKWKYCLAISEFCPYCGAFTSYHKTDGNGNRKCIRCETEWSSKTHGNYYATKSLEEEFGLSKNSAKNDKVELQTRLDKIEDNLEKIYSRIADLEIKFMGIERYNQIYDPTNEGEVAKQKKLDKYIKDVIEGKILQDE